jgi:hypothetical protein
MEHFTRQFYQSEYKFVKQGTEQPRSLRMSQDYKEEKEVPLHRKPQEGYMKFSEATDQKQLDSDGDKVTMFQPN